MNTLNRIAVLDDYQGVALSFGDWGGLGVPVDVYGVGSALVHGEGFDHTADIVRSGGRDVAKVGRRYTASERLERVDWDTLVGASETARS